MAELSDLKFTGQAVKSLRRRTGVGWGGVLLYLVLVLAGAAVVVVVGDPPVENTYRRRVSLEMLVPVVLFGLGLFGVVVATSNLPTYLRLSRTDGSDTGTVGNSDGAVVLTGAADTAGGTIETPFGGTAALAYTTRIMANSEDDAETARDSEANWMAVHVGEDATRLAVDDGSGPATVDPAGARLSLADSTEQFVAADQDLPAHVREHLREVGVDVDDDAHLRFEETALEPGEDAFVLGSARGGTVEADLLAEGDHEERVRSRVKLGAGLGGAATVVGYLGMLLVSGVF